MDLRKAAEGLAEELDTAAHWIESCQFENAIPHAEKLRKRADAIRAALAQPDMLAEAVEQVRLMTDAAENYYTYGNSELLETIYKSRDFIHRYYVAQQEQPQ